MDTDKCFDLASWLVTNYAYGDSLLNIIDIYDAYREHEWSSSLRHPQHVLTKMLLRIFPEAKRLRKNGGVILIGGLTKRQPPTPVTVPCEENGPSTTFTTQMQDGQNTVRCSITFCSNKWNIFCKDKEIPCALLQVDPSLPFSLETANLLLHLLTRHQICQSGMSTDCTIILSLMVQGESCAKCQKALKNKNYYRKRKAETQNRVTGLEDILSHLDDIPVSDYYTFTPTVEVAEEDHDDLLEILKKVIPDAPSNLHVLLNDQIRNCKVKDPRSRRWDPKVISTCLELFCRSPDAYKAWQSSGLLCLPSKRLLRYYKKQISDYNTDDLE